MILVIPLTKAWSPAARQAAIAARKAKTAGGGAVKAVEAAVEQTPSKVSFRTKHADDPVKAAKRRTELKALINHHGEKAQMALVGLRAAKRQNIAKFIQSHKDHFIANRRLMRQYRAELQSLKD